jgi:hypothetical protein
MSAFRFQKNPTATPPISRSIKNEKEPVFIGARVGSTHLQILRKKLLRYCTLQSEKWSKRKLKGKGS